MFINKNKDAERLKQISNDNLEKNIPVSGIFRLTLSKISFEMLVINSDDTSVSRRFWNDNYIRENGLKVPTVSNNLENMFNADIV